MPVDLTVEHLEGLFPNVTVASLERWVSGGTQERYVARVCTAAALAAYTRTASVILADAVGALGTIDGVTMAANDRILLKDGAAGADNGIWVVDVLGDGSTAFQLIRASDFDEDVEVVAGVSVVIAEGTANGDEVFILTTNDPIVVNTTALTFTQMPSLADLASTAFGHGSDLIGVYDVNNVWTATDLTGVLNELGEGGGVRQIPTRTVRGASTADEPSLVGAANPHDGVTYVDGERILLKDQTTPAENGIYVWSGVGVTDTLTRDTDFDALTTECKTGVMISVSEGTANADSIWRLTTNAPIVLGTTALTFAEVWTTARAQAYYALTTTPGGASYVGVFDTAANFTGTDVEACLAEIMSLLASTSASEGASLVGVEDSGGNFTGATVEAVLAEIWDNLELTTTPGGASYVGVFDTAGNFAGTNVEACLAEIWTTLALATTPGGASYVGVFDTAGNYAGTDVEACLAEIWTELASTTTGDGASYIGVEDSAANFAGTNVEACLAEIMSLLASTSTSEGAALVGIEDSAANYAATTVEAALAEIWTELASTTTGDGASYIGVEDAAGNFAATDVEAALAEIMSLLASVSTGEGAALVGVEDSGGNFTGATVEACLAEIWDDLELTTSPGGASYVGVFDTAGNYAGANVEACLAEIWTELASTTTGDGASYIGVEDAAANFAGTTVETVLAEIMSKLADTATGEGAALVGVEDSAGNFAGATVEACLAEVWTELASTGAGDGASYIGVQDSAANFAGTTVEACLAEIMSLLVSTANTEGASLVGIEDAAANFVATDVEAALAEIWTELASTAATDGASYIGINDTGSIITATTVEGALQENRTAIDAAEADIVTNTAAIAVNTAAVIQKREQQITHTDLTDAVNGNPETENISTALPANAVVIAHEVNIATLFSGGGLASMTIDVGGTDIDAIADAHDVFTGANTGALSFTPAGLHQHGKFSSEQLTCIFQPDGAHSCSDCTAGDLTITVWFHVLA